MSTPPSRKPLSNTSNTTPRTRQPENSPSRNLPSTPPSTGLGRTSSVRGGRPIRKAPARNSIAQEDNNDEDNSKELNAQLIADLKEQVERAEQASEQYRRQLESLQKRLDDVTDEQTAAEERDFATKTQIDKFSAELRESARQNREMEMNFESERNLMMQDKDRQNARETELQATINRLTDALRMKNLERASDARFESLADNEATPTEATGSGSEYLQLMQEKDNVIETLKLELADAHFKFAEHEHMGDGQLQLLETQLRDIKMQNARLVEENDSFQMLLSEKTLKGDFMHDQSAGTTGMSSLAEELESIGEDEEVPAEQYRKVEAELKNLREEKKALTLYIDKIIGRLLQHEGFEHIITGKDDDDSDAPSPPPKASTTNKPLPAAPAATTDRPSTAGEEAQPAQMTFLQRARSVVSRNPAPKQRPTSFMPSAPTANENPETAPSIPINKGHRRIRSDQNQSDLGAAAVVQQMNRGSPLRTASGSPMSPGISPLKRAQTSYFAPTTSNESSGVRPPSQSGTADKSSSANSIVSEHSLERDSTDISSNKRSSLNRDSAGGPIPGAVMKQNQLRPLRLVQEQTAADEDAARKAKRGSWMGPVGNWFSQAPTNT